MNRIQEIHRRSAKQLNRKQGHSASLGPLNRPENFADVELTALPEEEEEPKQVEVEPVLELNISRNNSKSPSLHRTIMDLKEYNGK